jgi:hypothetical protein
MPHWSRVITTLLQPLERDHQNQNAFHHQPAVRMFEKHGLHAAIGNGAYLGVIRRIQVKKRERFSFRNGVERVALNGLNTFGTGYSLPFGVKFDAIAASSCVAGNQVKRGAFFAWRLYPAPSSPTRGSTTDAG